jgi:cyclophilin family peptidyl-prolyl cis-trans isomerase
MSNRALILTVIAILIIFGGIVAYAQFRKPDKGGLKMAENQQTKPSNQDQPSDQPAADAPTTTPETAACVRDFDQNKLNTAKVALANRQVEMNVKDFGKITLEFYPSDAPKAVENFLRLTNSGYYDCLTFHRVAKGFVIQGGDPSGNGSGGTSAFGKPFADELNPATASYKAGYVKGVLAMANSGPNTNGSQFFIMLADNDLPHNYTIFGKVTIGLDVVDKIGQVEITPQMGPTDGAPKVPVVMQSVKITK